MYNHEEMKDIFQEAQTGSQGSPSTTTQSAANHSISNTNTSAPNNDLRDKFYQDSTPELCSNVSKDLLDLKVS